MPKTTKKASAKKVAAKLPQALKAVENMVVKQDELAVAHMTEKLSAAGITSDTGFISYAGRNSNGSGQVQVTFPSGGFASTWPDWAYAVAEGALHANKKVYVSYSAQPFGSNLLQVFCLNQSV